MVRLVFRPYTQVRRTICTSVSLRAPPEFPLASPRSGIVHHLSGPDRHAPTRTLHRRSGSASGDYPARQLPCASRVSAPVDSHACQTPWSVFQDGSDGEPTGRCIRVPCRRGTPKGARGFCGRIDGGHPRQAQGFGRRHGRQRSATRDKRHGGPQVRPIPSPSGSHRRPPSASLPAIFKHSLTLFSSPFHLSLAVLVRYRSLASI
ncbi:hypothetical protein LUZ60_017890 [Juncus effusus]|nr:hypothetical protein LUZ60_017890 [Juncus effusus]